MIISYSFFFQFLLEISDNEYLNISSKNIIFRTEFDSNMRQIDLFVV